MLHLYPRAPWALGTALLLAPAGVARAQAPIITATIPMANARAAARTSPVTVSFSQPLTAASAGALKVFSSQRGGLRSRGATPAVVSGNALTFAPSGYAFMPGETVQYSVTTAAAGSGGALAQARVGQFTTAAGSAGGGIFPGGADIGTGIYPKGVALGDVDGDGDLDLAVANGGSNTVSIRLNNGSGFGGTQDVSTALNPAHVVLADVDGDGDLDLLETNIGSMATPGNTVGVCLNNGAGSFGSAQYVGVGSNPLDLKMGDVDGDGDLDLLVVNSFIGAAFGTVSVRLNDGSGTFGGTQNVRVGQYPQEVAVNDIDGDGDLDLLVTNATSRTVSVCLNNGSSTFSSSQSLSTGTGTGPVGLTLGDVDGDGDADLLVANAGNDMVDVRLNNGSGTFGGAQNVAVGSSPDAIIAADVDGDGDLDFVTANYTVPSTVSIRLNTGGTFGGGANYSIDAHPLSLSLGDIDGDGDLDFVTANTTNNTVSVRLNGGTGPLATAAGHSSPTLTLYPNPTHGAAMLTGAAPNAPLTVLDALGRVRHTTTADAAGTAPIALPGGLPAGVYLVRSGGQTCRLAVE